MIIRSFSILNNVYTLHSLQIIKIIYKYPFPSLCISTLQYTRRRTESLALSQNINIQIKHLETQKLEILRKLDFGIKTVDVCKEFNLSQSTLSTWKKQKAKLKEMVDNGKILKTKCNRESFLPQVKSTLHLWFCEMRSKPHPPPLNQQLLAEKAT